MAKEENTALQVIESETGELIEVNVEGAQQAEQSDLREATKLETIVGPMAIIGVKFGIGMTFSGEFAELLILQDRSKVTFAVTASQSIVESLKRCSARGLGSPAKPLLVKFGQAKTSNGFTVHKLSSLDPTEEKALRVALSA